MSPPPNSAGEPRAPRLWLRVTVAVVVLIVACVVLGFVLDNRRGRSEVQVASDEVDASDPGWRLEEIEKARAEVPEAENGARVVLAARRLLKADWLKQEVWDALEAIPPEEPLPPDLQAQLASALDAPTVVAALHQARKLATLPRGRFPIAYAPNPINTLLEEQQKARAITGLLAQDARRLAQAGNLTAALVSCRAALNAARSLGDEPFGISQLIRIACVAVACLQIERVLAQGVPDGEDLAAVQRLLEEEDRFPTLLVVLRGERAMQHHLYRSVEKGTVSLGDDGTGTSSPGLVEGYFERRRLRYEQPFLLRTLTRRVEAARLPLHEQFDEIERLATVEHHELPPDTIMIRLLLPAVDKMCLASWRKHAQVRCLAVLIGVERYRQANRRWPNRLDELKPSFLKEVPLDPFDGKPLRYRRLGDGVIVYSVGEDRIDNGGVLDRKDPRRKGADLGYRLWDVERRRQAPAKKGS
jgi:hypothetical protein